MRAVISGASRGLGASFSRVFAKAGFDLCIIARDLTKLQELKAEIQTINDKVEILVISADLSHKFEAINAAQSVLNAWEEVDVLINNAGVYKTAPLERSDLMEELFKNNFSSAYYLTKPLIPQFRNQKKGHIINICSVLSESVRENAGDYAISKHALFAYSKSLGLELKKDGIKVISVLPGSINTSSWDGEDVPREEFIQPEDLAALCLSAVMTEPGTSVDEIRVSASNPNF